MPHGHHEVIGGHAHAGELCRHGVRMGEVATRVPRGELGEKDLEALVGEAAGERPQNVIGDVGRVQERAGVWSADDALEVVGDVVHDATAHAGVHGGAAQGDPLAALLDGRGGRLGSLGGLGLGGRGVGVAVGVLRLGGHVLLVRLDVVLLCHSRPFSQRRRPLSSATCSKVLFLMSMVMSAAAW